MILKDQDAVAYLRGALTVRDGVLTSVSLRNFESTSTAQLVFEMYLETPVRKVILELGDVREIAFCWMGEGVPHYVEMLKCLWTNDQFYLALDPYDERDVAPSDKDNQVFTSRSVLLTVEMMESVA